MDGGIQGEVGAPAEAPGQVGCSASAPGMETWQQHELWDDQQEQQLPARLRMSYEGSGDGGGGGLSPAGGLCTGPALNMEGPTKILGAGGKEEMVVPSGKPVSFLLALSPSSSLSLSPSSLLSVGLTLSRPLLCAFLLQLLFHRPTLSSPAPLQATVLMTRSRVDSLGLCCQCVGTDPSQHLSLSPVIRTFPSPWSGAVGGGEGEPCSWDTLWAAYR